MKNNMHGSVIIYFFIIVAFLLSHLFRHQDTQIHLNAEEHRDAATHLASLVEQENDIHSDEYHEDFDAFSRKLLLAKDFEGLLNYLEKYDTMIWKSHENEIMPFDLFYLKLYLLFMTNKSEEIASNIHEYHDFLKKEHEDDMAKEAFFIVELFFAVMYVHARHYSDSIDTTRQLERILDRHSGQLDKYLDQADRSSKAYTGLICTCYTLRCYAYLLDNQYEEAIEQFAIGRSKAGDDLDHVTRQLWLRNGQFFEKYANVEYVFCISDSSKTYPTRAVDEPEKVDVVISLIIEVLTKKDGKVVDTTTLIEGL